MLIVTKLLLLLEVSNRREKKTNNKNNKERKEHTQKLLLVLVVIPSLMTFNPVKLLKIQHNLRHDHWHRKIIVVNIKPLEYAKVLATVGPKHSKSVMPRYLLPWISFLSKLCGLWRAMLMIIFKTSNSLTMVSILRMTFTVLACPPFFLVETKTNDDIPSCKNKWIFFSILSFALVYSKDQRQMLRVEPLVDSWVVVRD